MPATAHRLLNAKPTSKPLAAPRILRIKQALLDAGGQESLNWGHNPATKKGANVLLFTCVVGYQVPTEGLYFKVQNFIKKELSNPPDLWGTVSQHTEKQWVARCKRNSFHRLTQAYKRLWRIAGRMVTEYGGDARQIWRSGQAAEALGRLEDLGVGPQLSRMTVGALRDMGKVSGCALVKADLHVRRVIGRIVDGAPATEARATELTSLIHPNDPWKLDNGLFQVGRKFCKPAAPACDDCGLRRDCAYQRIGRTSDRTPARISHG